MPRRGVRMNGTVGRAPKKQPSRREWSASTSGERGSRHRLLTRLVQRRIPYAGC